MNKLHLIVPPEVIYVGLIIAAHWIALWLP